MNYPALDGVIISLGPLALRWYGLAYLAGFVCAWWIGVRRVRRLAGWDEAAVQDMVFYAALGAIIGGRLGYVLFYGLQTALHDPLWIFKIWTGGMSSHGGLLGVIVALWLFARNTKRRWFHVTDLAAPMTPPGLFFGRLANFVNTELPGRVTDVQWGLHYPCWAVRELNSNCGEGFEAALRHPSPLYQAGCEGILLGILVWSFLARPRPTATASGLFLVGYGVLRLVSENFRQPDANLGFVLAGVITRGQLLSAPMVIGGLGLMVWGFLKEQPAPARDAAESAPTSAPSRATQTTGDGNTGDGNTADGKATRKARSAKKNRAR